MSSDSDGFLLRTDMKRILSLVLAIMLAFTFTVSGVFAEDAPAFDETVTAAQVETASEVTGGNESTATEETVPTTDGQNTGTTEENGSDQPASDGSADNSIDNNSEGDLYPGRTYGINAAGKNSENNGPYNITVYGKE